MTTDTDHLLSFADLPGALVPGVLLVHGDARSPWRLGCGDDSSASEGLLDLRDPLTRCAVARALAAAWGLEPGHTAPEWGWGADARVWYLDDAGDPTTSRWASAYQLGPGLVDFVVPGIPDGPGEDAAAVALAMTVRAFAAQARPAP